MFYIFYILPENYQLLFLIWPIPFLTIFFWNFIFKDKNIWDRFEIIMKYISSLRYLGDELAKSLCFVYGADRVFEAFIYNKQESGARSNFYKHRSRLKKFIEKTGSIKQPTKVIWYFDKKTHFFCEEKEYGNRWDFATVYRYNYGNRDRTEVFRLTRIFESIITQNI